MLPPSRSLGAAYRELVEMVTEALVITGERAKEYQAQAEAPSTV